MEILLNVAELSFCSHGNSPDLVCSFLVVGTWGLVIQDWGLRPRRGTAPLPCASIWPCVSALILHYLGTWVQEGGRPSAQGECPFLQICSFSLAGILSAPPGSVSAL